MAIDDITDEDLRLQRSAIAHAAADAALEKARAIASQYLLDHIAAVGSAVTGSSERRAGGIDTVSVMRTLAIRDTADQLFVALNPYERSWALLVVKLLAGGVVDPSTAIRDARDRGATVAQIAKALGITTQGVYATYSDAVVRQKRS